jgi:hypothetical protein
MSDCRFYVNEEERVVICVIPDTQEKFIDYVYDMERSRGKVRFVYDWVFTPELRLPKQFIGKAVCSKEDEWNEETGRMIAFSRAKSKFYKSFFKRANILVNTIDKTLTSMVNTFNSFGDVLNQKDLNLMSAIESRLAK